MAPQPASSFSSGDPFGVRGRHAAHRKRRKPGMVPAGITAVLIHFFLHPRSVNLEFNQPVAILQMEGVTPPARLFSPFPLLISFLLRVEVDRLCSRGSRSSTVSWGTTPRRSLAACKHKRSCMEASGAPLVKLSLHLCQVCFGQRPCCAEPIKKGNS